MSEETSSLWRQQDEALRRAKEAAESGDPQSMVAALYQSSALDGLIRRIGQKWPTLTLHNEVDFVIAQAIDTLYLEVMQGRQISSIVGFLWKVADRKAYDCHMTWQYEEPLDPEIAYDDTDNRIREREEKRVRAIAIARSLLPRLGQQHLQDVMSYLLEAVEAGYEDVSNSEIADALGLTPDTVRQSLSRGFRRLQRIAREEGIIDRDLDLPVLGRNMEGEPVNENTLT